VKDYIANIIIWSC